MIQENHSQLSVGESGRQLQLQSNLRLVVSDGDEFIDQVVELLISAVKDSPYASFPVDNEYLKQVVVEFSKLDAGRVLLLLVDNDRVAGLLAGTCSHGHPLAKDVKVATELVWWVHPDYRGSPDSFILFEAFEAWAKEIKASHIVGAHFNNKIGDRISKYYKDKGYSLLEMSYLKENK